VHRRLVLSSLFAASIIAIALAQTHRHSDANANKDEPETSSFQYRMVQAMDAMNDGMMSAAPTGDPDRDFARMMIPHHQGAIDVAKAELIYGRDPVLRRLAEGVIVEQQQEIELMQRRLNELTQKP
jgi:uncharacterized protein (DUF305 family)